MNKFLQTVMLAGVVVLMSGGTALAQGRMATVNLVEVFDNYWKTKQAKAALADSRNDTKKEIDTMQEAHKKLIAAYQKQVAEANDQAVSNEERDKRKQALEPKLKELQDSKDNLDRFVASREADLKNKMERLMETVIKDIRGVVAGKAKAAGYAYVIDSSARSASGTDVLLYTNGESDLTKPVLEELNVTAPPDAATK